MGTLSVPVGSALVLISTIIKIRQMIDKIQEIGLMEGST